MKEGRKGSKKTGRGKNILILFLALVIFSGVVYYFYQDKIDNTISEISYPTEVVYDFESDVIGEHPEGWSGWSWCGTEVVLWEKDVVHGQVIEIENRDGNGVETATRFKKAESGVVEFDIYCVYDNKKIGIDITQLTEDYDHVDDIRISLGGTDGVVKIRDGDNNNVRVQSFSAERWYHFKVEFNMEYWELWIDGKHILVHQGYYINYYEQPPYFCNLYFSTYVDDNRFYIDNVEIIVVDAL